MTTYSSKLRALADFLDDHAPAIMDYYCPEDSRWTYPSVEVYIALPTPDEDDSEDEIISKQVRMDSKKAYYRELITELPNFSKSGYDGMISARYTPDDAAGRPLFQISVSLSGACSATPKLDEDGKPVTRTIPARPAEEAKEIPEMEWHCPESFLQI